MRINYLVQLTIIFYGFVNGNVIYGRPNSSIGVSNIHRQRERYVLLFQFIGAYIILLNNCVYVVFF